jgi:hypothetical protein
MEKKKVKVVRKAVYTIEFLVYSDDTTTINRTAENFSAFELIGILELSKEDIVKQIKGEIKPDIVTRKVIVNKK